MSKVEDPEWGESSDGGTYLYVPYSDDFVEAFRDLRKEVNDAEQKKCFEWFGDDQRWWVRDDQVDDVESLLVTHFEDYEG